MTNEQRTQRLQGLRDYLQALQERRDSNTSKIAEVTQQIADLETQRTGG